MGKGMNVQAAQPTTVGKSRVTPINAMAAHSRMTAVPPEHKMMYVKNVRMEATNADPEEKAMTEMTKEDRADE